MATMIGDDGDRTAGPDSDGYDDDGAVMRMVTATQFDNGLGSHDDDDDDNGGAMANIGVRKRSVFQKSC